MSPAAASLFLLLLTVSFHLSAVAGSDTGYSPLSLLCPPPSQEGGKSCPINCFRSDPVCGENGVTYWCGCPDAACAGARVVRTGPCELGNGGSALLSPQAFFLIHILWLILLAFSVLCGFF